MTDCFSLAAGRSRGGGGGGGLGAAAARVAGASWPALGDFGLGGGAQGQSRGRLQLHLEVLPLELAKSTPPEQMPDPDRPSLRARLNPFNNFGMMTRVLFKDCPGGEHLKQLACLCCCATFAGIIIMSFMMKLPDLMVAALLG